MAYFEKILDNIILKTRKLSIKIFPKKYLRKRIPPNKMLSLILHQWVEKKIRLIQVFPKLRKYSNSKRLSFAKCKKNNTFGEARQPIQSVRANLSAYLGYLYLEKDVFVGKYCCIEVFSESCFYLYVLNMINIL